MIKRNRYLNQQNIHGILNKWPCLAHFNNKRHFLYSLIKKPRQTLFHISNRQMLKPLHRSWGYLRDSPGRILNAIWPWLYSADHFTWPPPSYHWPSQCEVCGRYPDPPRVPAGAATPLSPAAAGWWCLAVPPSLPEAGWWCSGAPPPPGMRSLHLSLVQPDITMQIASVITATVTVSKEDPFNQASSHENKCSISHRKKKTHHPTGILNWISIRIIKSSSSFSPLDHISKPKAMIQNF